MKIPQALLSKFLNRIDVLVEEGENILTKGEDIPPRYETSNGVRVLVQNAFRKIDWPSVVEWRTKTTTILSKVVPNGHPHYSTIETMSSVKNDPDEVAWGISILKALRSDLNEGFLDSLASSIEAEICSDYMGQAEQLLAEGRTGHFDHVPAAVLAGAVLESALRKLCGQQNPPLDTTNSKGEPKTMNPLIDDLKKAGVYNELRAKQLRAWADIRNKAAHGEFDQFRRSDVDQMLSGINSFLAEL